MRHLGDFRRHFGPSWAPKGPKGLPKSIINKSKKRCENRCRKSHEFHEKTMRNLDVFWIEILRTNDCVRKVPNADKPIKTNGFLMISWFARFKNRFGKLQKSIKKCLEKVMQKTLENHQKTSSKNDAKTMKKPSKHSLSLIGKRRVVRTTHSSRSPGDPWGR